MSFPLRLRGPSPAILFLLVALPLGVRAQAQAQPQAIDEAYTSPIHEFTTEEFFLTPLDFLGYVSGTRDVLTHAAEIYAYLRAVAEASPRVTVKTIGESEEGREVRAPSGVVEADAAATAAYLVRFNADNNLTAFRFAHPDLRIDTARSGFEAGGESFGPGSFILPVSGNLRELGQILEEAGGGYGFIALAVNSVPSEHTPHIGRQASSPDIRGGLELGGVANLQGFVEEGGTLLTIGNSSILPIHLGLTTGLSTRTAPELWAPGGVYRATRSDAANPLAWGYDDELGVYLNAGHGPLLNDGRPRPGARAPSIPEGSTTARRSGRVGIDERDQPQARGQDWGQASVQAYLEEHGEEPCGGGFGFFGAGSGPSEAVRTVFRFHQDPTQLLISGGLVNGRELTGSPALVDVKVGQGRVVMFSFNPLWRSATLGSDSLLFNALLHHGNLDAGAAVAEEDH